MRVRIWISAICVSTALVLLAGCSSKGKVAEPSVPGIASIVLSPDDEPLVSMGQLVQLAAVVTDTDGATVTNPDLIWSSSDEGVLAVDEDGLMEGVAGGIATVSAAVGGKTGSLPLRIVDLTGTWTGGVAPDMVSYSLMQSGTSVPGSFSSLLGFPPITDVNTGVLSGSLEFDRYEHVLTVITESDCEMRITGTYEVQVEPSGGLMLVGSGSAVISSPNCSIGGSIDLATLRPQ